VPYFIANRTVLGISERTASRKRKTVAGFPQPVRHGNGRLYYRRSDIDRYLSNLAPV
jgi:predicted DNA-binding transcriptional regulator AlpA